MVPPTLIANQLLMLLYLFEPFFTHVVSTNVSHKGRRGSGVPATEGSDLDVVVRPHFPPTPHTHSAFIVSPPTWTIPLPLSTSIIKSLTVGVVDFRVAFNVLPSISSDT